MDAELLRANLVRTLVPLIVGALASLLPALQGHDQLSTLVGFAVSALYYAGFRIAETRYPWVGVFLGKRMVRGGQTPAKGNARPVKAPTPLLGAVPGEVIMRVGGVDVPGVESLTWSSEEGQPPMLTLRIRDPRVAFSAPGAVVPAATAPVVTPPPQRTRRPRAEHS